MSVPPPTTNRKVMHLQDYVKYLICIFLTCLRNSYGNLPASSDRANEVKQNRGVLDVLIGRFKPCGGCLCGRSNHIAGRLLGGEYTDTHEYPWLVNIHVGSSNLMSGALINDRYVFTAASPLTNATAADVKVALGEYDRCTPGVSSVNTSVDAIILHPEFDLTSKARDMALLRLSRPTKFEKRVSPVCLPNPGSDYLGQVGTLSGWTQSEVSNTSTEASCRPRKLGLPILGKKECLKSVVNPHLFHDDSGCIGVIGGKAIVCENDVGTSVLYRSYSGVYDLVGIISDVNQCTDQPSTAIYTKVRLHLDWILQQTRDACYCTK